MVIHDPSVDRTTDGSGSVAELPAAALAELDAAARFGGWPRRCGIPSLAEVLAATAGFEQFELELKWDQVGRTERVVELTVAELARHGRSEAAVLTSFRPGALAIVARIAPQLRRGLIGDWSDPVMLRRALDLGVDRACVQLSTADAAVCDTARTAGLELIGWPCENAADLRQSLDLSLAGITTDRPSRASTGFR